MKKIIFSILIFTPSLLLAQTTRIENPKYEIYVSRPIDSWSPDQSHTEKVLDEIKNKKVSYSLYENGGKSQYRGSPLLFQSISEYPVTQRIKNLAPQIGIELAKNSGNTLTIFAGAEIKPSEFNFFVESQNKLFKKYVIAQGDPTKLEQKVNSQKIIGNLLAIAGTIYAADKLSKFLDPASSFNVAASNFSGDIHDFISRSKTAFVPVEFTSTIDLSKVTSVEIRKVQAYPEMLGQIVIAYKTEKTTEVQQEALVSAIIELTGATTSVEAIEKLRKINFERRLDILREENESKQ